MNQPADNTELLRENRLLREVYEAARQALRFNGVDKARTEQAIERLKNAIEQVKLLDGGLLDE